MSSLKLKAGLIQRVDALNAFLRDIYTEKRIVADGVIPEDFAFRQAASCRRVTTLFRRTEFTLIFQALTSSKLKTELGTFLKTTYAFLQALPILLIARNSLAVLRRRHLKITRSIATMITDSF